MKSAKNKNGGLAVWSDAGSAATAFVNSCSLSVSCSLTLLCLSLTSNAYADFYSCKDNAGHIVTSDRPIPECAKKSTQVFQDNGVLKNEIPAPPTPEERRAEQLLEQQRAVDAVRQDAIKQEQRYLTAHYRNEKAIEVARKHAIDEVEAKISVETATIGTATAALRKNQNALSVIPKNQIVKIHDLQLKCDDLNQTITESTRMIGNYQAEKITINRQFDDTHKRYAELIPINP